MIEIKGTYSEAKVYTDELEASAEGQIRALCEQPFIAESVDLLGFYCIFNIDRKI